MISAEHDDPPFFTEWQETPTGRRLVVQGEIDFHGRKQWFEILHQTILLLTETDPVRILQIDLCQVLFLDSSGVQGLIVTWQQLHQAGFHLHLITQKSSQPHRIITRIGLHLLMPVHC